MALHHPPQRPPAANATEEATAETSTGTAEAATNLIATDWTCPEEYAGQTLSIYNWATYIGDQTVATFEALCNVTVEYSIYDSDESMISVLRNGNPGYDVAFPTDYAVSILIREGLLQPINQDLIPNLGNALDRYVNLAFDPGNVYSIPYVGGTTGIAYNTEKFPDGITSWAQVFESQDARVAWLENPRGMLGAALIQLGFNPNSTNPDEINQAGDYLIENGGNVTVIAGDDGDAQLVQGIVDIAIEYGGDMFQQIADCACDTFAFANPVDGTILDVTSIVLLADGPNPALAQVFMDFMSDPAVAAHNTNTIKYATPNQVAIEQGLIDVDLLNSSAFNLSEEAQATAWYITDIGAEGEQLYADVWTQVTLNVGR